jgi:hypothetical protein
VTKEYITHYKHPCKTLTKVDENFRKWLLLPGKNKSKSEQTEDLVALLSRACKGNRSSDPQQQEKTLAQIQQEEYSAKQKAKNEKRLATIQAKKVTAAAAAAAATAAAATAAAAADAPARVGITTADATAGRTAGDTATRANAGTISSKQSAADVLLTTGTKRSVRGQVQINSKYYLTSYYNKLSLSYHLQRLDRLVAQDSSCSISDHDDIEDVQPKKRKKDSNRDDATLPTINDGSSSSSSSSSLRVFLATASAEIEAETTNYLMELKTQRAQRVIAEAAAVDNVKAQIHEVTLNREKEVLRHSQKLAETERAQNELVEKMEADLIHQSKAEAANRLLKARQKRLEWVQNKEREDYEEQLRRDNQDYEDQRQLKLLRAKRQIEKEDQGVLFEQQQTLQRQEYDRDLHKTVVLDALRKSKDGEDSMRSVIKTIFKPQEPPRKGEESESEESVEKKGQPYKPFHPFA